MDYYKEEGDFIELRLNPKLYSLDIVYSAAYQLLDDAFIIFDGDPDIEIKVRITPKNFDSESLEKKELLAKEFLNSLVNYTYYNINSAKKETLRALLLRKSFNDFNLKNLDSEISASVSETAISDCVSNAAKAISGHEVPKTEDVPEQKETESQEVEDSDLEFEDPDGIAVPWEQKFSNSDEE